MNATNNTIYTNNHNKDIDNFNKDINMNNMDNIDNMDEIYIVDLISKLDNLSKETEKNDFIKNYAELKHQIEKTDFILNNDNNDDIGENYNNCTIQELFNIIESNSDILVNPNKLDIIQLKKFIKISKILENKLESESINIIESK